MTATGVRERVVVRNFFYLALGVGIDAILVLVTLITLLARPVSAAGVLVVVAVLAPFLAFGLRAAMIRVVVDARGVRVVNLWRTYRVASTQVAGFAVCDRKLERFARRGRFRVFLGLVCVRRADGREIVLSAVSASGSFSEPRRYVTDKLPGVVQRLNRAGGNSINT